MIYEKEQRHAASRVVLAQAMGYAGISGSSAKTLSALRKFGLLEGRGEDMRLSDEGLAIILAPADSAERAEAIRGCAFRPELFAELRERFGEELPSDENLRYFLAKKGFSSKAADESINNYKETIRYVLENAAGEDKQSPNLAQRPDEGPNIDLFSEPMRHTRRAGPVVFSEFVGESDEGAQDAGSETLKYRISRDSHAEIRFIGPVTQGAVRKLIKLLELTVDDYPNDNGES